MLTRLVPPPPAQVLDEALLVAAVRWYPLAGLAVGACAVLPLWLGLGQPYPLVQGWLYVLLCLWGTRGLHWDGLADVADAWGSGHTGERFHTILKDSRIGAFGVMALVMGLLGCIVTAAPLCAAGRLDVLLLAPVLGRVAAVALAGTCPVHPHSTLGRLTCLGARPVVVLGLVLGGGLLACLLLGLVYGLGLGLVLALGLHGLGRLARREGGVNGDFLGTAILGTELATLSIGLMG